MDLMLCKKHFDFFYFLKQDAHADPTIRTQVAWNWDEFADQPLLI
jgi:mannosyltransferase OCH1-like enzyme